MSLIFVANCVVNRHLSTTLFVSHNLSRDSSLQPCLISGSQTNTALDGYVQWSLQHSKVSFHQQVMFVGSLSQVIAFSIQSSQPPFILLVIAYCFNGFGAGLQNAQANGLVANLPTTPATKMGILHSTYGLGALSAPLVATQFSQRKQWSFHFLVSLGIGIFNSIISGSVFQLRTQESESIICIAPFDIVS